MGNVARAATFNDPPVRAQREVSADLLVRGVCPLNDTERSLRSRIGAHESWARTDNRTERTAPARKAMLDRFEREVDPNGELTPQERAKRAEHARKAYFTRLSLKSAQARRRAFEARASIPAFEREAADADAELAAGGDAA